MNGLLCVLCESLRPLRDTLEQPGDRTRRDDANHDKYGKMGCMKKKASNPEETLVVESGTTSGASATMDTDQSAIEESIRRAAYRCLQELRGSEPGIRAVPRRREAPSQCKPH